MGLRVGAIDIDDGKLAHATRLGADLVINAKVGDPAAALKKETGGGAHGVLITAPSLGAFKQGVGMTRKHGTCVLIGLPPGEFPVPLFDVVANCITIRGSFVGTRQDMAEALSFAAEGKVKADIELQPLSSINQVFDRKDMPRNWLEAEAQLRHAGSDHPDQRDHHGHMAADFRKRFWISLALTLPILLLSPLLQTLVGLREAIRFSGDLYVLFGVASAVFWYGGWPFLKGLFKELTSRQPGMMTLVAVAITTAYPTSVTAGGRKRLTRSSLRTVLRTTPRFADGTSDRGLWWKNCRENSGGRENLRRCRRSHSAEASHNSESLKEEIAVILAVINLFSLAFLPLAFYKPQTERATSVLRR